MESFIWHTGCSWLQFHFMMIYCSVYSLLLETQGIFVFCNCSFFQRSGRVEEEIEILQNKLRNIDEGTVFGGKRTKIARSQGKKIQITIEQEKSRWILHSYSFLFLFFLLIFSANLSVFDPFL